MRRLRSGRAGVTSIFRSAGTGAVQITRSASRVSVCPPWRSVTRTLPASCWIRVTGTP
jgi:hypothetical protein